MDDWHLDKRVPIGLIAAIVLQTVCLGFWLGSLNNRVTNLETNGYSREQGARIEERIENNSRQIDRLEARTVASLDEIKESLKEIQRQLDEDRK